MKKKIEIYLETNDKENTTIQNLWDAAKTKPKVSRRKEIKKIRERIDTVKNLKTI